MGVSKEGYIRTRSLPAMLPGRTDVFMADPHQIRVDPDFNPRDFSKPGETERLEELKASILKNGVERPLFVYRMPGTTDLWLIDGERRLRAARMLTEHAEAGKPWDGSVPVQVVDHRHPADLLYLALRANDGKPLTMLEHGRAFHRIVQIAAADGWPLEYAKERIQENLGVRGRYITEALRLANLPLEMQALVESGQVAPAAALHEQRVAGHEAVERLKSRVTDGEVVRREKKAAPAPQNGSKSTVAASPALSRADVPPDSSTGQPAPIPAPIPAPPTQEPIALYTCDVCERRVAHVTTSEGTAKCETCLGPQPQTVKLATAFEIVEHLAKKPQTLAQLAELLEAAELILGEIPSIPTENEEGDANPILIELKAGTLRRLSVAADAIYQREGAPA